MTKLAILLFKNSELEKKWDWLRLISVLVIFICNIFLYAKLRHSYSNTHMYYLYLFGILGGIGAVNLTAKHPNMLEKINYAIIPAIYEKISKICLFIENKVFLNYEPIIFISKLPVKIIGWVEENIMNGAVRFVTYIFKGISKQYMIMQSGNVQTYNAYAFIIITILTALVLTSFWILIRII